MKRREGGKDRRRVGSMVWNKGAGRSEGGENVVREKRMGTKKGGWDVASVGGKEKGVERCREEAGEGRRE